MPLSSPSNSWPVRAYILLFIGLLSACAQQAPTIIPPPSDPLLPPPENWLIKAKLGIRHADDSGSVTLNWLQQGSRYKIRIQGPLGQGNALISGNEGLVAINRPGKNPVHSNQPSTLAQDIFGWPLPIDNLRYWMRGIANPEHAVLASTTDELGRLTSLQQSGWELNYSRYQQVGQRFLPGRIRAQHQETRFTLIIREWQVL